jgi:hypothetical protein
MPDPTPSPAAKVPFKKKGNPFMPPRQLYHAGRKSRVIRTFTKAFHVFTGRTRLTPEERGALAFFTLGYEVGERPE